MRQTFRGKCPATRRSSHGWAIGLLACGAALAPAAAGAAPASAAEPGALQGLLAPTSGGCSWNAQYGEGGQTVPETDTDAAYWGTSYLSLPGSGMTIQGTFPQARNMSFTVYRLSTVVNGGHLYDAQIEPDAGTVNPFQAGETGTGTYTLHVVDSDPPADPAPNTLYTDTATLTDVELVYRVYDATDPNSPEGDVPLPQTTLTFDGNPTQVNEPCVGSGGGSTSTSQAPSPARVSATPARADRPPARARRVPARARSSHRRAHAALRTVAAPTWIASKGSPIFPDPDNAYLSATTKSFNGQLVVVQAQMPTFADTNAGDPPWTPAQVRYWSVCENNGFPPDVVACTADYNAVEVGGVATFVISSPANRPPNATADDGVNWLSTGSADNNVIVYRQMLADPSFGQAIADVPQGSSPGTVMGSYLPAIAYCSEAEFAAAGAAGCLGTST